MSAIAGYAADLLIAGVAGSGSAFTHEATTAVIALTEYQITSTTKRYWDPTVALTVETSTNGVDWTAVTSGFQVAYAGGVILFPVAQPSSTQVRVSGAYLTASALGQSKEWDLSVSMDTPDSTVFTAGTSLSAWKTCVAALKDASVTVSRYQLDGYFVPSVADKGTFYVLVLYTDYANGKHVDCLARMTADSIKTAVSGVIEESLTFKTTGMINTIQAS